MSKANLKTRLNPGLKPGLATTHTLNAILRQDLGAFIQKAFHEVVPGSPFIHNWHIEALAYALEQVLAGNIKRLLITLPPRHLKSICASVAFPAWVLGHDPARRIIAVSYSDDLAGKHALDSRRLMESPWYRSVFPGTRLSKAKNTEGEYVTTEGGYRYSTSVGGALTGRGGNLIIIDDPQKPADALSDARRKGVNDWYDNTLFSRLDNKVADPIILVMQRLHLEDLAGHVLEQGKWTHLNLPAIAIEDQQIRLDDERVRRRRAGDLLMPALEPQHVLDDIRKQLGSFAFSAQYLQQPIPVEGSILQWRWFGRYEGALNLRADDLISQSWDPASVPGTQNDYSVCLTWLIRADRYYLLDIHRQQYDYPDLRKAVIRLADKWNTCEVIIEQANAGVSLLQELRRDQLLGERAVWGNRPRQDKVTRMAAHSAMLADGKVFIPRQAPWLEEFRKEVVQFPNGRYDDQIDALSQFLFRMTLLRTHLLQRPPGSCSGGGGGGSGGGGRSWPRPGICFD